MSSRKYSRRPELALAGWHSRRRDLRDRAVGGDLDLEELARAERHRSRDQVVREHLDARVEVLDVRVVDAAGGLDLVLDRGELGLESAEALRRLELGIGLRQRLDLPERRASGAPRRAPTSRTGRCAAIASARACVTCASVSRSWAA